MADDLLTLDYFNRHLEQTFRVTAQDTTVDLLLQQVTPIPPPRRRGDSGALERIDAGVRAEPFSLLFTGPLEEFLPQQTYALTTDGGDTLQVFLVPVGKAASGFTYQAIFS